MDIEHLNPEGMAKNPAFSQAVVVTGAQKLRPRPVKWCTSLTAGSSS